MQTADSQGVSLLNWRQQPHSRWAFQNVEKLLPMGRIAAGAVVPLAAGPELFLRNIAFEGPTGRITVPDALDDSGTDGFLVLHHGRVVAEHYPNGTMEGRHILFSVSKSITGLLCGVLVERGQLDPDAPVVTYVPEVSGSAYGECAVRHVLDMTVAINFVEDYLDPKGDFARYRVATGWNPPGVIPYTEGLHGFLATLRRAAHAHGERFHYVSPNSDLLGWIAERAGGDTFANLVSRHIWMPMGAEHSAQVTLDPEGAARSAGGICCTLRDLARLGELVRNGGAAGGQQVVPAAWIEDIFRNGDPAAWQRGEMTGLFPHGRYRTQWYSPDGNTDVTIAIGIHGQWIYVDRAAEMVIVKQSSQALPVDEAADRLMVAMFRAVGKTLNG